MHVRFADRTATEIMSSPVSVVPRVLGRQVDTRIANERSRGRPQVHRSDDGSSEPSGTHPTAASRLSYRVKIMYGVGEIANAIKVVTLGLYGLFFATTVMGLPGTWVGAVGFIAVVWDAVIDPYIGHVTDGVHVRSRRYSFMLIGALTMGVGFWAFFSPPHNLSPVMLTAWLLGASFLLRTATSMYSIPYYALGANLSQDYHERTSIAGIRGIASIVGTCAAGSLSFVHLLSGESAGCRSEARVWRLRVDGPCLWRW